MELKLTYDEAALFNSYKIATRRAFIDALIRGIAFAEDDEAEEIARSLRYKVRSLSNDEYRLLYNSMPLPCGF